MKKYAWLLRGSVEKSKTSDLKERSFYMIVKQPTVPGIPKTETIWLTFETAKGEKYYTTAKTHNRDYYYLYKLVDDKAQKLGRAKTPIELEEKYIK